MKKNYKPDANDKCESCYWILKGASGETYCTENLTRQQIYNIPRTMAGVMMPDMIVCLGGICDEFKQGDPK